MVAQLDIWGNMTRFIENEFWVKQLFINDKIIEYNDSDGNHWVKDYLPICPFYIYVLRNNDYFYYDYKEFTLTKVLISFSATSLPYFTFINPIINAEDSISILNICDYAIYDMMESSYILHNTISNLRVPTHMFTLFNNYSIDNITIEEITE